MAPPDVTIVVATYEGPQWPRIRDVRARAVACARSFGVPVVDYHVQGDSLAEARNGAVDLVQTDWVVHLDADDELDPGYLEAMATGTADIRAPRCIWLPPGRRATASSRASMPKVSGHLHDCAAECILEGNWLVVGAMVRTELVQRVRWVDWPCYEDWAFWLRCYHAGATFEAMPSAVYVAHSQRGGRNSVLHIRDRHDVHRQIAAAYGAPVP